MEIDKIRSIYSMEYKVASKNNIYTNFIIPFENIGKTLFMKTGKWRSYTWYDL